MKTKEWIALMSPERYLEAWREAKAAAAQPPLPNAELPPEPKRRRKRRTQAKQDRREAERVQRQLDRVVARLVKKAERVMEHGIPLSVAPEERKAIINRQEGQCAICHRPASLAIDHCHQTGRIRGALCCGCNWGLGLFRDDPTRLASAIQYLANAV